MLIGLPLVGDAVYGEPEGELLLSDGSGRHLTGKVTYGIRNLLSSRSIVVQFPAKAGYLRDSVGAYRTVDPERWPSFAKQSILIVIPPDETVAFDDTYNGIFSNDAQSETDEWCFVFSSDEPAKEQGELYFGCLSFQTSWESRD
ncbi:hypothetical protein [Blastopirellula retiformator]|uniref:hypothetical protein n=1 Tax=Blastopirellula retiformator TaxID=2527970 RepID=UPI0011B4AADD|nr:hypothetical protein [Blastopirellula retiformator]